MDTLKRLKMYIGAGKIYGSVGRIYTQTNAVVTTFLYVLGYRCA